MTLDGIRSGDIVLCDIRGRRFHALVGGRLGRTLQIIPAGVNAGRDTYREVTARQIVGHWRATTPTRRRLGISE